MKNDGYFSIYNYHVILMTLLLLHLSRQVLLDSRLKLLQHLLPLTSRIQPSERMNGKHPAGGVAFLWMHQAGKSLGREWFRAQGSPPLVQEISTLTDGCLDVCVESSLLTTLNALSACQANPDPVATLAKAHSCKCKPGKPHTIRGMLRVRYSEIVEAI